VKNGAPDSLKSRSHWAPLVVENSDYRRRSQRQLYSLHCLVAETGERPLYCKVYNCRRFWRLYSSRRFQRRQCGRGL